MLKLIDDRLPPLPLLFPPTKKDAIAQGKKLLAQKLSAIIRQFFQGSIAIKDLRAGKNYIQGIFLGGRQLYKFTISQNGNFSYVETNQAKFDARKCKVGKTCGDTCITKGKKCDGKIARFNNQDFKSLKQAVNLGVKGDWAASGLTLIVAGLATRQLMKQVGNQKLTSSDFSSQKAFSKYQKIALAATVGGIATAAVINSRNNKYVTHRQLDNSEWRQILEDETYDVKRNLDRSPQQINEISLQNIVETEENEIVNKNIETLVLINPKTGKVINRHQGNKHTVMLPYRDIKNLGGAIQTHNHQTDISFSNADVETAMTTQAHELRAISPSNRYSLKPPAQGWNRQYFEDVWHPVYQKYYTQAIQKYRKQWWNDEISQEQMLSLAQNETIEKLTKRLNIPYEIINHNLKQDSIRKDAKTITIIDDRSFNLQLLFPQTEQEAIAQGKKLTSQIFSKIISQFYSGNFTINALDTTDKKIIGRFSSQSQTYQFSIDAQGNFSYNEIQLVKQDANKCTKGKSCGDTCIAKGDKCTGKIKKFVPINFLGLKDAAKAVKSNKWAEAGLAIALGVILTRQTQKHLAQFPEFSEKIPQPVRDALVQNKVYQLENSIKNNNFETLIAIDPKTGKVVMNKPGDKYAVAISYDEFQKLKGTIVTHNHPATELEDGNKIARDVSFSGPDIATAMVAGLSEIRVVTGNSRYSMKQPEKGWNYYFYRYKWSFAYYKNSFILGRKYADKVRNTKPSKEQEKYYTAYFHEVMRDTAKQLDIPYKKTTNIPLVPMITVAKRQDAVSMQIITDRPTINLVTNILNRTSIKVKKIQNLNVNNGKINGTFWAMNGQYYKFDLLPDGKLSYQQQRTRRRK